MARREYWFRPNCAATGCREHANYVYTTRQDEKAAYARQAKDPWRCTRHTNPGEVLAVDNPATMAVYESRQREGLMNGRLFWFNVDGSKGGNGFIFGDGYKAYADDFPEGTRVVVTAELVVPDA